MSFGGIFSDFEFPVHSSENSNKYENDNCLSLPLHRVSRSKPCSQFEFGVLQISAIGPGERSVIFGRDCAGCARFRLCLISTAELSDGKAPDAVDRPCLLKSNFRPAESGEVCSQDEEDMGVENDTLGSVMLDLRPLRASCFSCFISSSLTLFSLHFMRMNIEWIGRFLSWLFRRSRKRKSVRLLIYVGTESSWLFWRLRVVRLKRSRRCGRVVSLLWLASKNFIRDSAAKGVGRLGIERKQLWARSISRRSVKFPSRLDRRQMRLFRKCSFRRPNNE